MPCRLRKSMDGAIVRLVVEYPRELEPLIDEFGIAQICRKNL